MLAPALNPLKQRRFCFPRRCWQLLSGLILFFLFLEVLTLFTTFQYAGNASFSRINNRFYLSAWVKIEGWSGQLLPLHKRWRPPTHEEVCAADMPWQELFAADTVQHDALANLATNMNCPTNQCNLLLNGLRKVALMFLTKGHMPHEVIWSKWFEQAASRVPWSSQSHLCQASKSTFEILMATLLDTCVPSNGTDTISNQFLFSVYMHAPPSFAGFNSSSLFYGRMIANRVQTQWGTFSLVTATKYLLAEALANRLNHWFVLLSESDIPLYPASVTYLQITSEEQSRIDACPSEQTDKRRWTRAMAREGLPLSNWRKSWQWFMMLRRHAEAVLEDYKIHSVFDRHCYPGERDCYSDEHYIPSLLSVLGMENETSCQRTITNVDWTRGGAHPRTYRSADVNPLRLRLLRKPHMRCTYTAAIRSGSRSFVRIDEMSQEMCSTGVPPYKGLGAQCPLFARKFPAYTTKALNTVMDSCSSKLYITTETTCAGKLPGVTPRVRRVAEPKQKPTVRVVSSRSAAGHPRAAVPAASRT